MLALIIGAAFFLRFPSIWFGYPLPVHPDEPIIVTTALNIVRTGDLNPHNFLYPSFNIYLHAFLYKIVMFSSHLVTGALPHSVLDIDYYVCSRALNVLLSTLTVFVVYATAKRLFDVTTGIVAACFIAISPLHLTNSYYATVDTATALWPALSCLMAVVIYSNSSRTRYYILGGIFTGLAIGSKYTAFPALLPLLVADYVQARSQGRFFTKNVYAILFSAPAAFLATTPYSLLDYPAFFQALVHQRQEYSISHPGFESVTGISLAPYSDYLFAEGYGRIPTALAIAGALTLGTKCRAKGAILLSFPVTIFLFLGMYKVFFPRNAVPLIPFLAIFSGYAVTRCAGWFGQRVSRQGALMPMRITTCASAAILVAVSLHYQLATDLKIVHENALPDSRWVALEWIRKTLPPGTTIGREHYTPPVENYTRAFNVIHLGYFGTFRRQDLLSSTDFIVTSSSDYSRFTDNSERYPEEAVFYSTFFAQHEIVQEFAGNGTSMTGPVIRICRIKHQ